MKTNILTHVWFLLGATSLMACSGNKDEKREIAPAQASTLDRNYSIKAFSGSERKPLNFAPNVNSEVSQSGSTLRVQDYTPAQQVATDANYLIYYAAKECGYHTFGRVITGSAPYAELGNPLLPWHPDPEPTTTPPDNLFIFQHEPKNCIYNEAALEITLCVANKLGQLADSVGVTTWNNIQDVSPLIFPPQNVQDRFIARELALYTMANFAWLSQHPPPNYGSRCEGLWAYALTDEQYGAENASELFMPYIPVSGKPPPSNVSRAESQLRTRTATLKAGAELIKQQIEKSYQEDAAQIELNAAKASGRGEAASATWGVAGELTGFHTARHALRILGGRWDIGWYGRTFTDYVHKVGGGSMNGDNLTLWGDPECEGINPYNLDARDFSIPSRKAIRSPETRGQTVASQMLAEQGIVVGRTHLNQTPVSWFRSNIRTQLLENAAKQAGYTSTTEFMGPNGRGQVLQGIFDKLTDGDISYALEQNLELYRLQSGKEVDTVDGASLSPWFKPNTLAIPDGIQNYGITVPGGLSGKEAVGDPAARYAAVMGASACEDAIFDNDTSLVQASAFPFQSTFAAAHVLQSQLSYIRDAIGVYKPSIKDKPVYRDAALASLGIKNWAASARIETWFERDMSPPPANAPGPRLVSSATVRILGLSFDDLGTNSDQVAGSVVVVVGDAHAAECAARLHAGCPDDLNALPNVAVVPPDGYPYSAEALSSDGQRFNAGGEGVDFRFHFQFSGANSQKPRYGQDARGLQSQDAYLVQLHDPKAPGDRGKVLGKLVFREPSIPDEGVVYTTYTLVSNLQNELLTRLANPSASWQAGGCANAPDPSKLGDYCVGDVPRDFYVPLENELTSDGDQFESSWRHYLTAAKEAAAKADALGEKLIDIGLQQELRREAAAEKLGADCDVFPDVDKIQITQDANGVSTSSDSKLAACTGSSRVDVLFLGHHPIAEDKNFKKNEPVTDDQKYEAAKAVLCCAEDEVNCQKPNPKVCGKDHFTSDSLDLIPYTPKPTSLAPCEQLGKVADSLQGKVDADAFAAVVTADFAQKSQIQDTIRTMHLTTYRVQLGQDQSRWAWKVESKGRVLMDSEPGKEWPGCARGEGPACATSGDQGQKITWLKHAFSSDGASMSDEVELSRVRARVESALWSLAAFARSAPEGLYRGYVPAIDWATVSNADLYSKMYPVPLAYADVEFEPDGTGTYRAAQKGHALKPDNVNKVDYNANDAKQLVRALSLQNDPLWPAPIGLVNGENQPEFDALQYIHTLETQGHIKLVPSVSQALQLPADDPNGEAAYYYITKLSKALASTGGVTCNGSFSSSTPSAGAMYEAVNYLEYARAPRVTFAATHETRYNRPLFEGRWSSHGFDLHVGDLFLGSPYKCDSLEREEISADFLRIDPSDQRLGYVTDGYDHNGTDYGNHYCNDGQSTITTSAMLSNCRPYVLGVLPGALPVVKGDCVVYEQMEKIDGTENYLMTKRITAPEQWPVASRFTYLMGAQRLAGDCGATANVTQALMLSCLSQNAVAASFSTAAPDLKTQDDLISYQSWLENLKVQVASIAAGMFMQRIPAEVVEMQKNENTDFSTSGGAHGTNVSQIHELMVQLPMIWNQISLSLGNISHSVEQTNAQLSIIDADTQSAAVSLTIARSQSTRNLASAVATLASSCSPSFGLSKEGLSGSWNPGACGGALHAYNAAKDTYKVEQDGYNKQEDLLKLKEQAQFMSALAQLDETTEAETTNISNQIITLQAKIIEANSLVKQLDSLEHKATFDAAQAAGEPFAPNPADPDGPPIPLPVNIVLANQYDLTKLRYEKAERDARYLAFMARRAIEQRIGISLSEITTSVGPDSPPKDWADELCTSQGVDFRELYQKIRTTPNYFSGDSTGAGGSINSAGAGGTTSVETSADDIMLGEFSKHANPYIGDYVDRLEKFVEYYNIQYPSHEGDDVAVISLRDHILHSDSACSRDSQNLLYFSGDLGSNSTVLQSKNGPLEVRGWQKGSCGVKCLSVGPSKDVPHAPPSPDGTGRSTSTWLVSTESVAPPTAATFTAGAGGTSGSSGAGQSGASAGGMSGGTAGAGGVGGVGGTAGAAGGGPVSDNTIPPLVAKQSVGQQVHLAPGTYVLSWWDAARNSDGDIPSGALTQNYNVSVATLSGKSLAAQLMTAHSPTEADPWSERRVLVFTQASSEDVVVSFGAPQADGSISLLLAAVQLEKATNGNQPSGYDHTTATRLVYDSSCKDAHRGEDLRKAFTYSCDGGACYYKFTAPLHLDTVSLSKNGGPLLGQFAGQNFNYRHVSLAANVVGTGVKNCEGATQSCYSEGYLQYSLYHQAYNIPIVNYNNVQSPNDSSTECFDFGTAKINRAKAIAAERVITNPIASADKALLDQSSVTKVEFRGRPLDGPYELIIWDQPGLNWNQVDDIQLVLNYHYWAPIVRANGSSSSP